MLTKDCWISIFKFLKPIDIINTMMLSKNIYKAYKSPLIFKMINGYMIRGCRPNLSQWKAIDKILYESENICKLYGKYASGKSIVSLSASINLQEKYKCKIIIIVSAKLIEKWIKTAEKFGITPLVIHNSNKNYKYNQYKNLSNLGKVNVVITTEKIYKKLKHLFTENNIFILDDCNDDFHIKCKKLICLCLDKPLENTGTIIKLDTFEIDNKLLPIFNTEYILPITKDILKRINDEFVYSEDTVIYTTYPFIDRTYINTVKIENKIYTCKYIYNLFNRESKGNFIDYLMKSPKFMCALNIVKNAQINNEKIILIDKTNIFLPYLYVAFDTLKIKCKILSIEDTIIQRQKVLNTFKNSSINLLLSCYTTIMQTYDLTSANHIIFYSQSNIDEINKCISCCHKYPQSKSVYIYHLYGTTIEKYINRYNEIQTDHNINFWSFKNLKYKDQLVNSQYLI